MPSKTELANAIRVLSMDAVQKANSGHPGMPMGMADIAEVLWNDFLQHNPKDPHWPNRDRFVISNGHGSMLLYALLHLSGYPDMQMEDLQQFRQLHAKTAGHPEFGLTPGIETTTGPLGQGIANAVGMALAERTLGAQFNQPGFNLIDHYTYVFLGDGCMMEGVSHESCSLAGHLGLGKLIAFWDDNGISIDGKVAGWFTDDTPKRFEAYGWHVVRDVDGHDSDAIHQAIVAARQETTKPSLICCHTTIAFGAPNLGGSHKAHGAALGEEEIALARKKLNWPHPPFVVPEAIYAAWNAREKGQHLQDEWQQLFTRYQQIHPELAKELERRLQGELPANWETLAEDFILRSQEAENNIASRKASLNALNHFGPLLPELLGGSADLTGSNLTRWSDCRTLTNQEHAGNYIYYGVREFGMSAIMNGIALHGGFIPYGGTFLVFMDYARNALRLASMMQQRVIFVFTHDSIGVGEDGPTHQPIEHINMLRITPNMSIWRPCDAVETAIAWKKALARKGPTSLLFSRQTLPHQTRALATLKDIERGAYVLLEPAEPPQAILIATGSEVALAIDVAKALNAKGHKIRVVSMPSTDVFATQDSDYRDSVLPPHITKRVALEAGATAYWHQYVGPEGKIIGLDRFGESAPAADVFAALGFSVENVIQTVLEVLNLCTGQKSRHPRAGGDPGKVAR